MDVSEEKTKPGKVKTTRIWLAFGIIIVLNALWQYVPLADAKLRLGRVPLKGLGFAGREVPLSKVERKVFGRASVIKRLYVAGGQQFVLTIIDGTTDRQAIHDPKYCFSGAGWKVNGSRDFNIPKGSGTVLSLEKAGQKVEGLIWFSDGERRYSNPFRYWMQTTIRRITLGWSGSEPVLILIQPAGKSEIQWNDLLNEFPSVFSI
jgi:hypothetical protein